VRQLAGGVFEHDVVVPLEAEYVALGAARQAVWALTAKLPTWKVEHAERVAGASDHAGVYTRHRELAALYAASQ
jgi:xylulokinase